MRSPVLSYQRAPRDDPRDLLAGTPYRALGRLGQGGMGEVIEAEHRALCKRVVVKLLHRQFAGDPRFVDRLRVEAQTLAAVSSPHVVSVTDLGETALGRPYLVMERLHGRTLGEELERRGGVLPVPEAIGIVRQVLSGLAAAHRIGIIHRDVKPGNVFICEAPGGGDRLVKVLDFGIAKVLQGDASPCPILAPQYATEEGVLVGSPRTLSPEQARCQPVDARADIYAAGLMLYTLVVGEGPFAHAQDMLALLSAHVCELPTPPSRVAQQAVPLQLDRAILKALAKRPEQRFQTAEEFSEELGSIMSSLPTSGTANESEVVTLVQPASRATLPQSVTEPDRPAEAREFLLAVAVSTVAFGAIAVLVFRYLGFAGWH